EPYGVARPTPPAVPSGRAVDEELEATFRPPTVVVASPNPPDPLRSFREHGEEPGQLFGEPKAINSPGEWLKIPCYSPVRDNPAQSPVLDNPEQSADDQGHSRSELRYRWRWPAGLAVADPGVENPPTLGVDLRQNPRRRVQDAAGAAMGDRKG